MTSSAITILFKSGTGIPARVEDIQVQGQESLCHFISQRVPGVAGWT
ncbi:MAG: hypothetical protein R3C20_14820 [Planctomycetaceae bacterium]